MNSSEWPRPRLAAAIFCVLLASLAVARMLGISAHTPMLAMANNYDQIRAMALLGISPIDQTVKFGEQSMSRPIRTFAANRQTERIYYAAETEILRFISEARKLASAAPNVQAVFDIKLKGLVEVVLVAILGIVFLAFFFKLSPWYGLTYGAAFLAWADPVNTLYANTLYPEFFISACAFLMLSAFAYAALTNSRWRPSFYAGSVLLLLLGLGKPQYALVPVVVLLCLPLLPRFRIPSCLTVVGSIAIVSIVMLWWADRQPWMTSLKLANRVNVVFDTLLPALSDPVAGIEQLGLPASCSQFVGKNWYTDDERVQPLIKEHCPQVAQVGLSRIAGTVLSQPTSISRLILMGLDNSHPYYERLLGHIEHGDFAKISALPGLRYWSLADVFNQPRGRSLFFNVYVTGAVALILIAVFIAWRRRQTAVIFILMLQLGLIAYYFATSLVGDGIFDMARHNYLHQSFLPCAALVACAALWASRSPRIRVGQLPGTAQSAR